MTYCVALNLENGMLFASDSRTNAGVDHVSTFRKMRVYHKNDDRVIVVLSAGNLATTQSVHSIMEKLISHNQDEHLLNVSSMYDAAVLLGKTMVEVQERDAAGFGGSTADIGASLLLGGQIKGEKPRLFNIYPQGNFIESSPETPYFQIGESKYGKPIIDRVVKHSTDLIEAKKCVLISFDSTIRSNLSVGLPIDLCLLKAGDFNLPTVKQIGKEDAYFSQLSQSWSEGLKRAFALLPDPQ